ncbi:helix-turn-helix transcriptional regulator [Buchananella felis]|uniref:helix-turn-helix domain-containing protein n=1 Tax=Buchananella felis TaxID=3231492 RepID=UPI0035287712
MSAHVIQGRNAMEGFVHVIESARTAANISQRALAKKTGISQPTLSRILSGERVPKMPELILIADAIGCSTSQLTGNGISARVECAARANEGTYPHEMKQRLLHMLEIDALLDLLGATE